VGYTENVKQRQFEQNNTKVSQRNETKNRHFDISLVPQTNQSSQIKMKQLRAYVGFDEWLGYKQHN
jgi:hypothetical protein